METNPNVHYCGATTDASDMTGNGWAVAHQADSERNAYMADLRTGLDTKNKAAAGADVHGTYLQVDGISVNIEEAGGQMLLDDNLSRLSLLDQTPAQLLTAKTSTSKAVGQLMR
jgi:hypothetical protein